MADRATPAVIFGYASLINEASLRATVPNARNVRPAYIKGFHREFNKLDPEGFTETNLELAGVPYCALNITADERAGRVNGIVFEVGQDYMEALRRRESGYDLVETPAYDFHGGTVLASCAAFSARQRDGRYIFGELAQQRYLETCLEGAQSHGAAFYEEFLATTYIDEKALSQVAGLTKLIRGFG